MYCKNEFEIMYDLFGLRYKDILEKLNKQTKDVKTFFQYSDKKLAELGCTSPLIKKMNAFKKLHTVTAKVCNLDLFKINSPGSVANIYMEELRYQKKEIIKIVFLDTKNGIICDKDISIGTINASLVDPREVYTEALEVGAVNIILIHNHPSGNPTPSTDDIDVTKRCFDAGNILGISLLDHIIIGDGIFQSLKELGLGHLH
jgi:DNA repair protein RadC